MTVATALLLEFDRALSLDQAENVVRQLGEEQVPARPVVLRFTEFSYVQPGAGWRLGNALRRHGNAGLVHVEVPEFAPRSREWFTTFTRSGLGDAIAAHAIVATARGDDVTTDVRAYYGRERTRASQNAVHFGELHSGLSLDVSRLDLFRDTFLHCLPYVNVLAARFPRTPLLSLLRSAFEAVQNCYDHAARRPLPTGEQIISYLSMRHVRKLGRYHDPTGRFAQYRSRLPGELLGYEQPFLEITVTDDGVGIAARQALTSEIYWGPPDVERRALADALNHSRSVKLRAGDARVRGTPGAGFTYIEAGLAAVSGFCMIRSGRLAAVFDATAAGAGFQLLDDTLGYMPGTTLHVLVPVPAAAETQPSLFEE